MQAAEQLVPKGRRWKLVAGIASLFPVAWKAVGTMGDIDFIVDTYSKADSFFGGFLREYWEFALMLLGLALIFSYVRKKAPIEEGNRQLQGQLAAAEEGNRQLQGQLAAAEEGNRQLRESEHNLRAKLEEAVEDFTIEKAKGEELGRLLSSTIESHREEMLRITATKIVELYNKLTRAESTDDRRKHFDAICGLKGKYLDHLGREQRKLDHDLWRAYSRILDACDNRTAEALEEPVRMIASFYHLPDL